MREQKISPTAQDLGSRMEAVTLRENTTEERRAAALTVADHALVHGYPNEVPDLLAMLGLGGAR